MTDISANVLKQAYIEMDRILALEAGVTVLTQRMAGRSISAVHTVVIRPQRI